VYHREDSRVRDAALNVTGATLLHAKAGDQARMAQSSPFGAMVSARRAWRPSTRQRRTGDRWCSAV